MAEPTAGGGRAAAIGALVQLALRRTLTPGALALWAAWTALLATRDWHTEAIALAGDGGSNAAVADAQARAGVLGAALILLTPLLLLQAVRLHGRVAGAERAGVASLPIGTSQRQVGLWLGSITAAVALCAATAIAAELAGGWGGPPVRGILGTLNNGALTLVGDGQLERFELPPLPLEAEVLHARTVVLPAEATVAEVAIELVRFEDTTQVSSRQAAIAGRRALELDLPPGEGPLVLTLARVDAGPGVAIPARGIDVLGRQRAPLLAGLELTLHAWLGLVLASSLVPLLRQFVSAPLAGGLLASLWIAAWLEAPLVAHLPAATLLTDMDVLARGLSPGPPSATTFAGTAVACLASLAVAGLREARDGRPLA